MYCPITTCLRSQLRGDPSQVVPRPRFRERGRGAHEASAFLGQCGASRVVKMRRHDELLGAAKRPGAAPWSAGCVTGAGRGTRAESAPGAERARRAKPGHFAPSRSMPFVFTAGPPHRRAKRAPDVRIRDGHPTWRRTNTCSAEQTSPTRASLPQLRAARASRGTTHSAGAGEHNFGGDRAPGGNVAPRRQTTSHCGRGRASARDALSRTARGASITYERDVAAGRITTWTQAASGEPTKTYTFGYDDTNQLTSATLAVSGQPDEVTTYSYDAAGNRLTELTNSVGANFSCNALNQLTEISGTAPPEATYQWDAQDRLVEVALGTTTVELAYDGSSRLTSVIASDSTSTLDNKRYVWTGDSLAAQLDAAGAVTRRFLRQGMSIDHGPQLGPYYYARDHLGSIRDLVDDAGTNRARYTYSPFGLQSKVAGDVDSTFGFTGILHQQDLGLSIARSRAYEASIGRWVSMDRLWNEPPGGRDAPVQPVTGSLVAEDQINASINLYLYTDGDPVNRVDRSGRSWAAAAAGVGAGLALGYVFFAWKCATKCIENLPKDAPSGESCDREIRNERLQHAACWRMCSAGLHIIGWGDAPGIGSGVGSWAGGVPPGP